MYEPVPDRARDHFEPISHKHRDAQLEAGAKDMRNSVQKYANFTTSGVFRFPHENDYFVGALEGN